MKDPAQTFSAPPHLAQQTHAATERVGLSIIVNGATKHRAHHVYRRPLAVELIACTPL